MARKSMKLVDDRQNYVSANGKCPPTAVIVGGRAGYTNVKKLPDLLWENYGIAVIDHIVDNPRFDRMYDWAIFLVDLLDHGTFDSTKHMAAQSVYVPSSWSKLSLSLDELGAEHCSGPQTYMPIFSDTAPAVVVEPTPEPLEPETEPMTDSPKTVLPPEIRELLKELKEKMAASQVKSLDLELNDDTLTVHFQVVVVTNHSTEV